MGKEEKEERGTIICTGVGVNLAEPSDYASIRRNEAVIMQTAAHLTSKAGRARAGLKLCIP